MHKAAARRSIRHMNSFIVPAFNEELLLPRALASVHASARAAHSVSGRYEIIVVNDGSTDRTAEIARSHGANVVDVRYRHIARVRNAGVRSSRGDRLFFLDADTILNPSALAEACAALDSGAAGGAAKVRFDQPVPWPSLVASSFFFRMIYLAGMATGAFAFSTRAAFAAAGGFDERFYTAEDCRFAKALRRHGRFALLRSHVLTSGRKLRKYSPMQLAGIFGRIVLKGEAAMTSREGLEYWYGEDRGPAADSAGPARHPAAPAPCGRP